MERRLAALLSLDVVGYSRLMNEDEERTHRAVRDTFNSLINPKATEYHGRICAHAITVNCAAMHI